MEIKTKISLNLFMWVLMPVILFAFVGVAIPYVIRMIDVKTDSDKRTDWVIALLNSDIKMQKADSISLPLEYGVLLHQGSVKHLFPDLQCKELELSHSSDEHRIFLMLYTKSNVPIIVDSLYYDNGEWIGFNMQNGKEVRLGKMVGTPRLNETIVDISGTYINAYAILTLGVVLICLGFLLWKWCIPNGFGMFLLWTLLFFITVCVVLLIDSFRGVRVASPYLPEIIATLFIASEISVVFTAFNQLYAKTKQETNDGKE